MLCSNKQSACSSLCFAAVVTLVATAFTRPVGAAPLRGGETEDTTLSNYTKRHDAFIYDIKKAHENGSRRRTVEGNGIDAGTAPSLIWKDTDKLLVQVTSAQPDAEASLRPVLESAVDFETVACSTFTCSGYLNIELLDDAEALASVLSIRPSITIFDRTFGSGSLVSGAVSAQFGSGSVVSGAVFAHMIDKIKEKYPYLDGSGIKIGVLSDSYDRSSSVVTRAAGDIASGDLPPGVQVLNDTIATGKDEGRAMLQLIHDIAPGAQLAFHTGTGGGEEGFAKGVRALGDAGCDVIVDDITLPLAPFFQQGIAARIANDIAEVQGIPYFTSAGNNARKSWEGPFVNSGIVFNGCVAHDFGGGSIRQAITVTASDTLIVLQWDQPFFSVSGIGSQSDIDIYLFRPGSSTVVKSSTDKNKVNGDPIEAFEIDDTGDYEIIICQSGDGPAPGLMKWIAFSGGIKNVNPPANASTSFGHKNTPYTAAVGAAFDMQFFSELSLEAFSSAGGTPLLFERDGTRKASPQILKQPRFVGFDGSLNTFFGVPTGVYGPLYKGTDGYVFYGTSAAAPNVAAIAALMLQAVGSPRLTPLQVYDIMETTAIDILVPGFDFDSGHGVVSGIDCVNRILGRRSASIPPAYCEPDRFTNSSSLTSTTSSVTLTTSNVRLRSQQGGSTTITTSSASNMVRGRGFQV